MGDFLHSNTALGGDERMTERGKKDLGRSPLWRFPVALQCPHQYSLASENLCTQHSKACLQATSFPPQPHEHWPPVCLSVSVYLTLLGISHERHAVICSLPTWLRSLARQAVVETVLWQVSAFPCSSLLMALHGIDNAFESPFTRGQTFGRFLASGYSEIMLLWIFILWVGIYFIFLHFWVAW